ncbi:hypothetical protein A9Q78_07610 [Methylophaga sp. 41_12_T18]|nr:hypothetical protein A9Q78_07610 [Methylophaga sp. 41_12_T18]
MSVLTKLLPVVIALSACSHNDAQPKRKPAQQKEVFTTEISNNDEKIFNLHLSSGYQQRPNGNGGPPAGNRGTPPSGDRGGPPPGGANGGNMPTRQGSQGGHDIDEQQVREQLEQRLKNHVNTTQYCRDGYIIHHTFVGMSSQILTGECVELATQNDRIDFPNVASATLKK